MDTKPEKTLDELLAKVEKDPFLNLFAIMAQAEPIIARGGAAFVAREIWRFAKEAGLTYQQTKEILIKLEAETVAQLAEIKITSQPTTTQH